MSYTYKPKTDAELKKIAARILDIHPHRRSGHAIDVEGIIEDLGVDVIPRRGFRGYAEGYLASDPRFIVIDESIYSYMPRARFTLAEEICHLILEYRLWEDGSLPEGARCHELSEKQHMLVEKDARSLASIFLMPESEFELVFRDKLRELQAAGVPTTKALQLARDHTAKEFDVSPQAAGWRAWKLKILDKDGGLR